MIKKTQPVKGNAKKSALKSQINNELKKKTGKKNNSHYQSKHKRQYGTSKLEADFARDYLDKLGLKYIYEYEAKDIKRFYDFAVTAYDDIPFVMENKHGIESIKQEGQNVPISFMIEVDGGYW